jgi:NAD(P)-dependent dehydrogenase (short-subunit alcohol dehydrogenase family)
MSIEKTIVITGGGIGLGAQLTRFYGHAGHRVIICGRTESALRAAEDYGKVHSFCVDPVGRTAARRKCRKAAGGGKSGLHGDAVPDNVRRRRPQGKCHRKQTARLSRRRAREGFRARVKGWGKSPPRHW